MDILCNGKQHTTSNTTTLDDLLLELNLEPDTVVAEVNKKIINHDQYKSLHLSDGDHVELIRFVGGG